MATSFINREVDETLLLDLKHLLKEAKQKIPPVLMTLDDPSGIRCSLALLCLCAACSALRPVLLTEKFIDVDNIKGCAYCGGLGHRVVECPKLLSANKAKSAKNIYGTLVLSLACHCAHVCVESAGYDMVENSL